MIAKTKNISKLKKNNNVLCFLVLSFLNVSILSINAQNLSVSSDQNNQINQIVSYLEYSLNVMGDPDMSVQDKEVISTSSYLNVFKDANVQIEDDLTEKRSQPVYKNVQAYLRDISFFFQKAVFELKITSIEKKLSEEEKPYFIVTVQRKISGQTKSNQKFSNTVTRYIELVPNFQQELKIVSIYSTKLFQSEENIQWWDKLSNNWKKEFAKYIVLSEGFTLANLMETKGAFNWKENYEWLDNNGKYHQLSLTKDAWSDKIQSLFLIQQINLSGENFFTNVQPLSKFIYLERVNLENTQVKNLDGLRNATSLKELYLTNTNIDNIEAVVNLTQLEKLYLGNTKLLSISGIENLFRLKDLNISHTFIAGKEMSKIAHLKSIETLNISKCKISDFQFVTGLQNLKSLDISGTDVQNMLFLSSSKQLERLWIENTVVASLEPLKELEKLQYIFCDGSAITKTEAKAFATYLPKCMVIYESKLLNSWWENIPDDVKKSFHASTNNAFQPTKEELHQIIRTKQLILSNKNIKDIAWIKYFTNIEILDLSNNPLENIAPLIQSKSLLEINLSNTLVKDISVLGALDAINEIQLENTAITSLASLQNLELLRFLNINNTKVPTQDAFRFQADHENVLVIYNSTTLNKWWMELPNAWKEVLQTRFSVSAPTDAQLHKISRVTDFTIENNTQITTLEPIKELRNIRNLTVVGTNISNIADLYYLYLLKSLNIARNPIQDFTIIGTLFSLEELNMSSVRIKDISFLSQNTYIQSLNISNTQVKNLKPIANYRYLLTLDISNTPVVNLNALKKLPLQKLICFNTKLKPKQIEAFKKLHPTCEVIFY